MRSSKALRKGLSSAAPIAIGYVPIAIAFGVIARQAGLPFVETVLMSMMVFAGASQFMAVQMATAGALGMEIIVATLVLNFRHFVMSLSLMDRLRDAPLLTKAGLSFGITDETFAVASMDEQGQDTPLHPAYMAGLILLAYGSWVSGTVIGALFAQVIPPAISDSMNIALYAMFIGLVGAGGPQNVEGRGHCADRDGFERPVRLVFARGLGDDFGYRIGGRVWCGFDAEGRAV